MTDKQFKSLRRSDLIEIIYEYQKREKNMTEEIRSLRERLSTKDRSEEISSLSEAVSRLSKIIESANIYKNDDPENIGFINNVIKNDDEASEKKVSVRNESTGRKKRKKTNKR